MVTQEQQEINIRMFINRIFPYGNPAVPSTERDFGFHLYTWMENHYKPMNGLNTCVKVFFLNQLT